MFENSAQLANSKSICYLFRPIEKLWFDVEDEGAAHDDIDVVKLVYFIILIFLLSAFHERMILGLILKSYIVFRYHQ